MFRLVRLLLWLLTSGGVALTQGCPNGCVCESGVLDMTISCSSKGGTLSLETIPCDTTRLRVHHSLLKEISANDLSCSSKLTHLDLRNNLISHIEEGALNSLNLLQALLLSGNRLSTLPVLESLTNLVIIDASNNIFTEFPLSFPPANRYFDIDFGFNAFHPIVMPFSALYVWLPGCSLSNLPVTFFRHGSTVLNLDISFNHLTSVKSLNNLHNLRGLDLSHNDLTGIENFTNFKHVVHVVLQRNKIRTLNYDAFAGLQQLESLDLSKNRIMNISAIRNMSLLSELLLKDNEIISITRYALNNLPKLKALDLARNRLTMIPIVHLPNLQSVTINYNFVHSEICLNEISFNVTHLNLEGNRVSNVSVNGITQITNIYAARNLIRSVNFPDPSLSFRHLIHLDLSYNFLQNLESFQSFPELQTLYLRRNFISVWNERGVVNMTKLSWLFLNHNQIRELRQLPILPALEYIDLSCNHVSWIREGAFQFPHLRKLNLSNNNLLIAPSFSQLSLLQILDMSANQIHSFGNEVVGQVFLSLKTLFLDRNQLRRLPQFDNNIIRFLSLKQNNITAINSSDLMSYLSLTHLVLDGNEISEPIQLLPSSLIHLSLTNTNMILMNNTTWYFPQRLRYLSFSENEMPFIENNLHLSQSLILLRLSFNRIRNISQRVFISLNKLQTLVLNHNSLTSVDANTFAGLDRVYFLRLDWNRLSFLPEDVFRNCPLLHNIDLSGNPLIQMSGQVFHGLSNLDYVYVSHSCMNVSDFPFGSSSGGSAGDSRITYLHLDNNTAVASWAQNPSWSADMDLYSLRLRNNRLSSVFPRIKSKALVTLDLSENCFHSVPEQLHKYAEYPILKNLLLSKNKIIVVSEGDLSLFSKLSTLLLDNNAIVSIESGAFSHSTQCDTINLENNHLTFLDQRALPSTSGLVSLSPGGNPWHCDCHLLPFRRWLSYLPQPVTCATPVSKRNSSLLDVTINDRDCDLVPEICAASHPFLVANIKDIGLCLPCPIAMESRSGIVWNSPGGRILGSNNSLSNHSSAYVDNDRRLCFGLLTENASGYYSCHFIGRGIEPVVFNLSLFILETETDVVSSTSLSAGEWANSINCSTTDKRESANASRSSDPTYHIIALIIPMLIGLILDYIELCNH